MDFCGARELDGQFAFGSQTHAEVLPVHLKDDVVQEGRGDGGEELDVGVAEGEVGKGVGGDEDGAQGGEDGEGGVEVFGE